MHSIPIPIIGRTYRIGTRRYVVADLCGEGLDASVVAQPTTQPPTTQLMKVVRFPLASFNVIAQLEAVERGGHRK